MSQTEKKEYEVKGLEAIWAEVTVNASKMIVGSVYIPPTPGREEKLKKLELIMTRILRENNEANHWDGCQCKECGVGQLSYWEKSPQ